jgi:23S rRNA pseudouridine955/2504/2580 synthase
LTPAARPSYSGDEPTMSFSEHVFQAGPDDSGKRIDRVLRTLFPDLSLSWAYKALRQGDIRINGRKARPDDRLSDGDRIIVRSPHTEDTPPSAGKQDSEPHPSPATMKKSRFTDFPELLLFENDDILVINKPAGMQSHGEGGADLAAREYLRGKIPESLAFHPGPLHRLDRNTTGILCLSKSIEGARKGTAAFRERSIKKYYLAIVEGDVVSPDQWIDSLLRIKSEGRTVKNDLCGKKAITSVFPLVRGSGCSLCLFRIETGRTHQIRAQSSLHGHPLRGDRKYGSRERTGSYLLHCLALAFPSDDAKIFPPLIEAPPPASAIRAIAALFGQDAIAEIASATRRIIDSETI